MNIEIKSLQGKILFSSNFQTIGEALKEAIKSRANLSRADLYGDNLSRADLSRANLSGADLSRADLSRADLKKIISSRTIVGIGDLIVWKKLAGGMLCQLRIPAKAKRVGGVIGRKCRAEYAEVLSGSGVSYHDIAFKYIEGEIVRPVAFDPNPLVECAPGIHFFITKEEAEAY